jgi:OmpA-OmpF porin, OOP family
MRKWTVFGLLLLSIRFIQAQSSDTTIFAQGKIMNASNKQAVIARVSFQSLPYGNKVGSRMGSEYAFPLFDNDKYTITVEADGFETYITTLDPATANSSRKVVKDVELIYAAPKAAAEPELNKVIVLNSLNFDKMSSRISAAAHEELNEIAKMLIERPSMAIQIEGHTEKDTNKEIGRENLKLSKERVISVKKYLVSKGVSANRVETKAFGGTKPIYLGNDPKQRALNRRVEIRILKN